VTSEKRVQLRIFRLGSVVSIVLLAALIAFSLMHVTEARRFALLLKQAEPLWVLLAVACQVGTYICAGSIWGFVAAAAGHRLSHAHLARLAIEKLSVDHFVPTGGMAGNIVVIGAMRRMGLPAAVATEALLIDILAYYAAFTGVAAIALVVLWAHHDVTPILVGLLTVFALLIALVPLTLVWLLKHGDWKPGSRLTRLQVVSRVLGVLREVSAKRVWNPRLLAIATALQAGIFLLDAATLWAMLRALGTTVHPLTTFVALVMASIAGTLSFLPGGIGSFEAGSTTTLALLGVPVEAALTGTLLLRGLTLWLPLLPGILLARRDLSPQAATGSEDHALTESKAPGASLPTLIELLATRREGLTTAEATARLARGANMIELKRRQTALGELVRSVASPLALILLAASVASLFLGEMADAVIITAMVFLSASINSWQSSRSARAVRRLQSQVTPTATVLRDGVWTTIPRHAVVVGDVVQLSAGDLVPADARLVESTDLHVQQSALTGESLPAEKIATELALGGIGPDARELVFAGTSVVSGTAIAVVFATGERTAFGDIAARLAARPEETEFERGSRHFGMLILQTVTFLVLFILVVSLAMERDAFQSLLFAVALAVGLTPEYLPMITTVTLSQGAAQMARQKVIVKHLASIQNLGSIDVLCSDKTGTLTSGRMSLEASLDPLGRPSERTLFLGHLNSAFETGVKSTLDAAILERPVAGADGYRKIAEVPFDFERRRLSVVVEKNQEQILVTKGAPESVLSCCVRLETDGQTRELDAEAHRRCLELFQKLSADGYRVLAVAYRVVTATKQSSRDQERELVLVGFLTFADQLLPGVDQAIASLQSDGITVKILSGDNELVTRTLCSQVGIDTERIVTGEELAHLDEMALVRVAETSSVFARLSPAQKYRIVMALKHHGHVVGFMGDGINDAPSLHGADVGISVAGAVDVAQEASDILLLEKRLDVLHAGIVAGRRSFANVLKYLLMGTSSNFGNMLSMAGAVFFLPFLPMLPTQLLVNNFLYDLAQITIPTDNVDPAYVRNPQRWDIGVIRKFMLMIGPVSSLFDFVTFGVLLYVFRFGESLFQSGWFIESLAT
jgi:Mg2+-importing ATPase